MIPIETRTLRIPSGASFPEDDLKGTITLLRRGGVVVYPTDTFYALGVNAYEAAGVEKIYALKARERGKPLSIVVADMAMAGSVALNPPPVFERLAAAFWPGPLSLIVRARSGFPLSMLGPGGTIAMRVPALDWLRTLLARAGFPFTATSANLSGEAEIGDPDEVRREFNGRVDLIINGGQTPGGAPSTIVDLTGPRPRLLREGAIPWERINPFDTPG